MTKSPLALHRKYLTHRVRYFLSATLLPVVIDVYLRGRKIDVGRRSWLTTEILLCKVRKYKQDDNCNDRNDWTATTFFDDNWLI